MDGLLKLYVNYSMNSPNCWFSLIINLEQTLELIIKFYNNNKENKYKINQADISYLKELTIASNEIEYDFD